MNFIKEFYYGNLEPQSLSFTKDSEMAKIMNTITSSEEYLNKHISDNNKEYFNALSKANMELNSITVEEAFTKGFRYGARFVLDVFGDK